MNERIRELINQMNQAGLPYGDNAMTVTDRDLEYFAELIVQECAELCINEGRTHDQWFGSHCAITVKEHFGVEE
jgi:hypothetical protein